MKTDIFLRLCQLIVLVIFLIWVFDSINETMDKYKSSDEENEVNSQHSIYQKGVH